MINPQVDPIPEPPATPPLRAAPSVVSRAAAIRPPIFAGTKTRLTFIPYVPTGGSTQVDATRAFTVLVNPAEVTHTRSISYDKQSGWGSPGSTPRFGSMGNDTMKFALVLDGTGVIPSPLGVSLEVKQQLKRLEAAVHRYDGTDRQPPYVRIVWGSLIFGGRLESMSTRFTLFTPSGSPLRANVDLSFIGSVDRKEVEAITGAAAGAQSKEVLVREGDTLLELCAQIYGDLQRCKAVARLNRLQSLRDVAPGVKLLFPSRFEPKQ